LASHTGTQAFFQRLWSAPGDEYSYRLLQQTASLLSAEDAIINLQLASLNPKLTSQSYLLLAKHFADNSQVQDYLFNALQDKTNQWYAASALGNMQTKGLFDRVQRLAEQDSQPAINFVLQQLAGGSQ